MIGGYFIYLDVCSIALFAGMIFALVYRRTIFSSSGKFFLMMLIVGLISSIADIFSINSKIGYLGVYIANIIYLSCRAYISFCFCLYIIGLTDNWHRFYKKFWLKLLLSLPFLAIVGILISNWWTHWAFSIVEGEYQRGILINYGIFYVGTLIYLLIALIYFLIYRSFFTKAKQFAMVVIYPLEAIALLVQFLRPDWLVEISATAVASLLILSIIERPEEYYEPDIELQKYTAFKEDSYKAARTKKKASLIFIKIVNEAMLTAKLSYDEQMSVRKTIGNLMKSTAKDFKAKGVFYWIGEGQYSCVLPNVGHEDAESYAMTLRRRLNVPVKCDFGIVDLYSNVALVNCPEDISSAETAISFTEKFVHIPNVLDSILDLATVPNRKDFEIEVNMTSIIRRGLLNKSFDVYFQPIYSVKDNCFTRAEALLRLKDEIYGNIPPKMFLPEAERNGSIHKIGDIVFDKVCAFIASDSFKESGLEKIEINLGVTQCMHEDLPIHIMDAVKRYGVSPSSINLEITETPDAYSRKMMEDNIKVLKELGFSFSLDDYGRGYSSMDNVSHMPVDSIKLDKSLTNTENPEMKVMFEHSIKLIRDLKKKVVIEGLEDPSALSQFEASLTDYIQGYYFSKPLPQDEFIKFINESKGATYEEITEKIKNLKDYNKEEEKEIEEDLNASDYEMNEDSMGIITSSSLKQDE